MFGEKKPKVCSQCGRETDTLYGESYCHECYAEIWDRGFEVTTEWGDQVGHSDLNSDLDDDLNVDPQAYRKIIDEILRNFEFANWECLKCETIRLVEADQGSMTNTQISEVLMQPCPACGATGYLHHYFKGAK